ncbi:MAG: DinB family protein [Candidatus Dormibacteraeota bacterium]|nr:DinB family protein [Candidatus Dormibacteraeota bacterium]
MTAEERRESLARYREGYRVLAAAIAELSETELDTVPADGGWSPRQVVHHCADSEMTAAIRLRRLLAEDQPLITGYDQAEFAHRLHYERPVEASLAAIQGARTTSVEILERVTETDWARKGTHNELGSYGVEDWLRIYADHCHDHAEQIRAAVQR